MDPQTVPEPGTYENLSEAQQSDVQRWLGVLAAQAGDPGRTGRTVGLWVHGAACSGTTYAASAAVTRAVRRIDRGIYGIREWEYVTARDLERLVRESWSSAGRQHPDDYTLWAEEQTTDVLLDRLWSGCDLLWMDDLDGESTDMAFFTRHIFPSLDERVKRGQATVVATSLDADQLGVAMSARVRSRFVVMSAP